MIDEGPRNFIVATPDNEEQLAAMGRMRRPGMNRLMGDEKPRNDSGAGSPLHSEGTVSIALEKIDRAGQSVAGAKPFGA
jgi:hypothetical protein